MAVKRAIILSLATGALVSAVPEGVGALYLNRVQAKYQSLTVLNPQFHAGEGIDINRASVVPDECIPKYMRYFRYDTGKRWILLDAPGLPNGPDTIPTTPRMPTGCGTYNERMSAQGCGWLSGVFPPLGGPSPPVRACVLQAIPLVTK